MSKNPATTSERPSLSLVRRARKINRLLAETYPDADCELDFDNPFQLLVATVLSAQSTDRRVNSIRTALFDRWPDPIAMAGADRAELEEVIRPTGFFRAKANHLLGLAAVLAAEYDGRVPDDMDALVKLPGVGRKTALVVLGNAFGHPGITADTHFMRLAERFAWISPDAALNPVKVEKQVAALFEPEDWTMLSHHVIWHGRRRCHAQRPACGACPVARLCPSYGIGPTDPVEAESRVTTQGRA